MENDEFKDCILMSKPIVFQKKWVKKDKED
jgi:hypothetical protein